MCFDVGLYGSDVFELEGRDVGTPVEEEGLAVASVLSYTILAILVDSKERMCMRENKLTRPVAPQHASLASSSTMLFPFALSSSERNRATDVPVIPLPTITMSASVGSSLVVRWPRRNSFGSVCQKELVDFSVGRVERTCFILWYGPRYQAGQRVFVCKLGKAEALDVAGRSRCSSVFGMAASYRCRFTSNKQC